MTKHEKRIIQRREAKLWDKMRWYETQWGKEDKSYQSALKRWCAVHDLLEELKINPDYTLRTEGREVQL